MNDRSSEIWNRILRAEQDENLPAVKPRAGKKEAAHSIIGPRLCFWNAPRTCANWPNSQMARPAKHCASIPSTPPCFSFRARDGEAEVHEQCTDLFLVLDGRATLVTGGLVVDPRDRGSGRTRGSAIEGGSRQELRAGDVAHVPAGVPTRCWCAAIRRSPVLW